MSAFSLVNSPQHAEQALKILRPIAGPSVLSANSGVASAATAGTSFLSAWSLSSSSAASSSAAPVASQFQIAAANQVQMTATHQLPTNSSIASSLTSAASFTTTPSSATMMPQATMTSASNTSGHAASEAELEVIWKEVVENVMSLFNGEPLRLSVEQINARVRWVVLFYEGMCIK
jgi:hypothetical protein